jgi:hypothetical protein
MLYYNVSPLYHMLTTPLLLQHIHNCAPKHVTPVCQAVANKLEELVAKVYVKVCNLTLRQRGPR